MDLYNIDLDQVRLLLTLVKNQAEHIKTNPASTFVRWKEERLLSTLQKRLEDEILHASQGR